MRQKLGQHFLIDQTVVRDIMLLADIQPEDMVVEIGPGQGELTGQLLDRAGTVLAIEWDEELLIKLQQRFADRQNLILIQADVRTFDLVGYLHSLQKGQVNYSIVANMPYYLSSFWLRQVFQLAELPSKMVLLLQKEVAERICCREGSSDRSVLSVMVQMYCTPSIGRIVLAEAFRPAPQVMSAITVFEDIENPFSSPEEAKDFFRTVKAGFGEKRKRLANALAGGLHREKSDIEVLLADVRIDIDARAQDLTLDQWKKLHQKLDEAP